MPTTTDHLKRVHLVCLDALADEARRVRFLRMTYPGLGDEHPGHGREGHAQHLLFMALRQAGYFTVAETNYFNSRSSGRQVDLGVWLPDVRRWLYLEVKPCGPQGGDANVRSDAKKLIKDAPTDSRDRLRGVLAYGFRFPAAGDDDFPGKYERTGPKLAKLGFQEVGISRRMLEGGQYLYVQVGMWAIGVGDD